MLDIAEGIPRAGVVDERFPGMAICVAVLGLICSPTGSPKMSIPDASALRRPKLEC